MSSGKIETKYREYGIRVKKENFETKLTIGKIRSKKWKLSNMKILKFLRIFEILKNFDIDRTFPYHVQKQRFSR